MINVACGHGTVIKQPVLLNELPWFQDFLKSQSNFSLGLQQIKGKYIPYFEALLASLEPAPGWPAVVAGPVERVDTFVCRIIRDTQLAEHIKSLHNHQCQICGYTIIMPDGSRYAEGHHIQPLGAPHDGPDTGDNILCLCPNHHVICDKGAMRLSLDDLRKVDGHAISQQFLDYHNRVMYRGNAWSLGDS